MQLCKYKLFVLSPIPLIICDKLFASFMVMRTANYYLKAQIVVTNIN